MILIKKVGQNNSVLLSEIPGSELQKLRDEIDDIITQRGCGVPCLKDFNPEVDVNWEISFDTEETETHPFTNPAKLTDDELVYCATQINNQFLISKFGHC